MSALASPPRRYPSMILNDAPVSQLVRHWRPNLGRLITPRNYSRLDDWALAGGSWAADNDRFNDNWSEDRFGEMIERIATGDPGCRTAVPGCLFVTVPDTVCDAQATLDEFERLYPILGGGEPLLLPLALVLQNGQENLPVPWECLAAVFIGGDTPWKLGEAAALLAEEAKARGKHVHMGRVNSDTRLRYAAEIGCDSVDGTGYSRFRETHLQRGLRVAAERPQPRRLRLV
jgi:hypothetical protein